MKTEKMSYGQMMYDVMSRLGHEDPRTINFCLMCENSTTKDERTMCEYKYEELMGYFNPEEDEPCFIGEIDEEPHLKKVTTFYWVEALNSCENIKFEITCLDWEYALMVYNNLARGIDVSYVHILDGTTGEILKSTR